MLDWHLKWTLTVWIADIHGQNSLRNLIFDENFNYANFLILTCVKEDRSHWKNPTCTRWVKSHCLCEPLTVKSKGNNDNKFHRVYLPKIFGWYDRYNSLILGKYVAVVTVHGYGINLPKKGEKSNQNSEPGKSTRLIWRKVLKKRMRLYGEEKINSSTVYRHPGISTSFPITPETGEWKRW